MPDCQPTFPISDPTKCLRAAMKTEAHKTGRNKTPIIYADKNSIQKGSDQVLSFVCRNLKTTKVVMRVILVAIACSQVLNCFAQNNLSVTYKGDPLAYAIQDIQSKLGKGEFKFDKCFQHTKPVWYKARNQPLDTILTHVFAGQPLEAKIVFDVFSVFPRPTKGRVVDENGDPIEGVYIQGPNAKVAVTNKYGCYEMPMGACDSFFVYTCVNRQTDTEMVCGRTQIDVVMKIRRDDLSTLGVFNTGYELSPKDRSTGCFAPLGEPEIRRQVFSNVMDVLESRVSGLSFNKNVLSWTNQPFEEIRGTATIHAGTEPLIVIDNFPAQSRQALNMLNPQDILSVTVLKDAAATSIWGARAGNGVIVITTNTGRYNKPLKFFVSSNATLTVKPNLWYMPMLNSAEYIDMETARYKAGYYSNNLNDPAGLLSPVIEILYNADNGKITATEKDELLDQLRKRDVRSDLQHLFYRTAVANRHFISLEGGKEHVNYLVSAGYDKEQLSLVTADKRRITTNGKLQLKKKNFEFSMNSYFSFGLVHNDMAAPGGLYPFSNLKNDTGGAEIVYADIRQHFKDSVGQFMQDWNYRPLQELYEHKQTQRNIQYRLSLSGSYKLSDKLNLRIIYQRDQGKTETEDLKTAQSYEARNRSNRFATIRNGNVDYIIPMGGILDWQLSEYRSDRIRAQLNFKSKPRKSLQLTALAGIETSSTQIDTTALTYYGYYGDRRPIDLDFQNAKPLSYDPSQTDFIPHADNTSSAYDYFVSYYGNGAFNYKNRYTLSLSARLDRSNLFGATTNKKGVPLGSVGFKWDLSEEPFYHLSAIPYLCFRASYGSSGNVSKFTTAYVSAVATQSSPGTVYSILSAANPDLRWEQSRMLNAGFSLNDKNRHFYFSFDYYTRKSRDLMGPGEQDPILGLSSQWGNFAALQGRGFDLSLQTDHDVGKLKIENQLLISRSTNTVTKYQSTHIDAGYFVDPRYLRPREGYPVYSIFAFKWAGLDKAGDPMGFQEGPTTNYNGIFQGPADSLVFKGSAIPTLYGSVQSAISWKRLKLSFTIAGKFNYSFRRSSVNYSDPYSTLLAGRDDFSRRWQSGGDINTYVPALKLSSPTRDLFYNYAEILVEKGDHIRLRDVRLEFDCQSIIPRSWKIRSLTTYIYAANLGIIWSANKLKVDPDFLYGPPVPKSFTAGFCFDF